MILMTALLIIVLIYILYTYKTRFIGEIEHFKPVSQSIKCSDIKKISDENALRIEKYRPIINSLNSISEQLNCSDCKSPDIKGIVDDINNKLETLKTVKKQMPDPESSTKPV